jgi:hypothetical protein
MSYFASLMGLTDLSFFGLSLPSLQGINQKKALYTYNPVLTCRTSYGTTTGAVSTTCCCLQLAVAFSAPSLTLCAAHFQMAAIKRIIEEASKTKEVQEATISPARSSTCPSAPSTIPSSSPPLSRASSGARYAFWEDEEDCFGLSKDAQEGDDSTLDDVADCDLAHTDTKAMLEGWPCQGDDTLPAFFRF